MATAIEWTDKSCVDYYGQDRPLWVSNIVEHGVLDQKGRVVGGYIRIERWRMSEPDPENPGRYRDSGRYEWDVRIFATRNGERYGATPHGSRYKTLEQAQAAAVKKLSEQGRRYVKQYSAESK